MFRPVLSCLSKQQPLALHFTMIKQLLALTSIALVASAAHASILYNHNSQTFTAGNLSGQNGWADHSGTGTPVQVQTDGLFTLEMGSGSRQDVNINVGAFSAGNTYYAAFTFSIDSVGTVNDDVYFAHFLDGTSTFRNRIWIDAPASAGDFSLGFSNGSSIESTWASDLSFDTEYTVVTAFEFDSGNATLWLDPASMADTSIAAGASTSPLSAFAFRVASGSTTHNINNLVVGTDFDMVLAAVPEPRFYAGLIGLAVLGLALVRRRR